MRSHLLRILSGGNAALSLWAAALSAQTGGAADENERVIVPQAFRVTAGPVSQLDPWREIPRDRAERAFRAEVEFWLKRVGKISAQWPLELRSEPAPAK